MKAFLIARVSTADQVDALPAQEYRLLDYARSKGFEFELFKFHESAYKGSREKFRAVVDKIQDSSEKIIVVFDKVDRFTRDSSAEETNILKRLCLEGKIEIHVPSDNLYLDKDSPASEKMRLGLNTVFAEYYSAAISDNVRRRFEQLHRDGIWTGSAPTGYKNVTLDNGKKWIELTLLHSRAIKSAFELYATGSYSVFLVRKKIIDEYGLVLTTSQWHKVLRNPFYMGTMRIKGKLYKHNYKTIVSEELFDKVQDVFDGFAVKPKRWAGLPYPYRGLISCSECGCRITFEKKKQKYIYGHCTQFKGKHNASYVNQDDITKELKEAISTIHLPQHGYEQVRQALLADSENLEKESKEKLAEVNLQIGSLEAKADKNYDMFLDGKITEEKYTKKDKELTETIKNLNQTRKNIELVAKNDFTRELYLLEVMRKAPDLFENSENEEKREFLNKVLSNLELEDKELRWKLKKPYDNMADCIKTQNWLGWRDSNPRMPGPKPGALPLGHIPSNNIIT